MKLNTVDNRPPVAVNVRLDAAIYDLAVSYREYAEMKGQHFKTDGQLVSAIVEAFVKRGDKDFLTWRRMRAELPVAKKTQRKTNGVDISPASPLPFEDSAAMKVVGKT